MAVNTERKRRSVNQLPPLTILPPADSSIDSQDRMIVSWLYGGISPGAVSVISAEEIVLDLYNDRVRSVTLYSNRTPDIDIYNDREREVTFER